MILPSILILAGVLLGIFILSALSSAVDVSTGNWPVLATQFPSTAHDIDAESGSNRIFLFTQAQWENSQRRVSWFWWLLFPIGFWLYFRRWHVGRYTVAYLADATHLHLTNDSGTFGAKSSMSIPFVDMQMFHIGPTHIGELAWFQVGQFVLGIPTAMIETELRTRSLFQQPAQGETPVLE